MEILEHIAQDSFSASENFRIKLDAFLDGLTVSPFRFQQSRYFDEGNIRDTVFKKYTIVYRVNTAKETIDILRIFNRNKPPVKSFSDT